MGWLGIAAGITLMLISGLMWLCSNQQTSAATLTPERIQVVLLPAKGQLRLHNNGKQDIYLWGNKFADTPPAIEKESRRIPAGHFYYFLTNKLEENARQVIGTTGERLVPFEIYLTDLASKQFIAKFNLLITIKNAEIEIHTPQLDVTNQDWHAKK